MCVECVDVGWVIVDGIDVVGFGEWCVGGGGLYCGGYVVLWVGVGC